MVRRAVKFAPGTHATYIVLSNLNMEVQRTYFDISKIELDEALTYLNERNEENQMSGQGSTGNVLSAIASFVYPGLGRMALN